MATNLYKEGEKVIYKKTGQEMAVVSWKFDGKPGGPLYLCSDGFQHREWNLAPVGSDQANRWIKNIAEQVQKPVMAQVDFHQVEKDTAKSLIPDNKEHAINKWKINPDLDLVQQAADFYITNEAAMDHKVLKPQADKQADFLADQFSRYLAMAIGGELRHTRTSQHASWISQPVAQVLEEISYDKKTWKILSRNQAWYRWAEIFLPKGYKQRTGLIRTARRIFRRGRWNRCYGGNNWSLIAKTLYEYLHQDITATTFVDTVFGLYHNCNLVLDKVWKVDSLTHTLDANFKHDMTALYQKCSQDTKGVISLWRRFNHDL